jgi:hypothetical protein
MEIKNCWRFTSTCPLSPYSDFALSLLLQKLKCIKAFQVVVASKLLSNGSVNALPGNRYVLNSRRIVGSGVFFAVCSEAT